MRQYLQNKKGLVQNVFNKVYDKYDLMNDFEDIGAYLFNYLLMIIYRKCQNYQKLKL